MNIFKHKDNTYLRIKGHSFIVLNLFYLSQKLAYLQCISQTKDRILKEYLDKKTYELIRTKHEGNIIYTIYNKNYFKYRKLKGIGNLLFIAPTQKGCIHIASGFLYNTYADKNKAGITQESINESITSSIGKSYVSTFAKEIDNDINDGQLVAINFQGSSYYAESFLRRIGYNGN